MTWLRFARGPIILASLCLAYLLAFFGVSVIIADVEETEEASGADGSPRVSRSRPHIKVGSDDGAEEEKEPKVCLLARDVGPASR